MSGRTSVVWASARVFLITLVAAAMFLPSLAQAPPMPPPDHREIFAELLDIKELRLEDVPAQGIGEFGRIFVSCSEAAQVKAIYLLANRSVLGIDDWLQVHDLLVYLVDPSEARVGLGFVELTDVFYSGIELLSAANVRPQPVPTPAGGVVRIELFVQSNLPDRIPEAITVVALVETQKSSACSLTVNVA